MTEYLVQEYDKIHSYRGIPNIFQNERVNLVNLYKTSELGLGYLSWPNAWHFLYSESLLFLNSRLLILHCMSQHSKIPRAVAPPFFITSDKSNISNFEKSPVVGKFQLKTQVGENFVKILT